jgi:hypothetical protein
MLAYLATKEQFLLDAHVIEDNVRDAVNETVVDFNDRFLATLKGEITVAIEENLQGKIKV